MIQPGAPGYIPIAMVMAMVRNSIKQGTVSSNKFYKCVGQTYVTVSDRLLISNSFILYH